MTVINHLINRDSKTKPKKTAEEAKREYDQKRRLEIRDSKNAVKEIPECVDLDLRRQCLASLEKFTVTCFGHIFTDPFGDVQIDSMAQEQRMIEHGGNLNKLEPRGFGKSTRTIVASIWGCLNGHQDFIMVCCDSKEKAEDLIKIAVSALRENEVLLGLFPEVWPFHALRNSHGCQYQTWQGRKTKIDFRGDTICFPVLDGEFACEGKMIVARPFKKARGKNVEGRRPSLVILDDVQSTEDALSPTAPRKLIKFLTTDIAKLGDNKNPVSVINNATIIADRDYPSLACELNAFTTVRYKMVNAFPADYEKGGGLWVEYLKIRTDHGDTVEDKQRAKERALKFYQANRDEMDAGESVTWDYAFSRKPADHEISTIQSAINFIQDWGRAAFDSECQNQAFAEGDAKGFLTAKEIANKQHAYGEMVVPPWCDLIVAYIDVQQEMFIWKIWCFRKEDFTGGNIKFSTFPQQKDRYWTKKTLKLTLSDLYKTTTLEARQKQGLIDLTDDLCQHEFTREGDGAQMQIEKIGIDSRYQTEVVRDAYRESKNKGRLQLCMGQFYGVKTKPQRHKVIKKRSGAAKGFGYYLTPAVQGIQTLEIDSNRLKTFVHQRYATAMGDPGSFSLYEADPIYHELNADHEKAEFFHRLEGPWGEVDEWEVKPGRPDNDGFDCSVGCVAIASLQGAKMVGVEDREDGRIHRKKVDGKKWAKR